MINLKQKFREKEGIAFIITLGLLAVLMITGVSFAVYMKVEREAAANFALVGSCRQLALAGVAYAMDDISFSLDDENDDNNDGLEFYWYPALTDTWNSEHYFHGWYTTTADFGQNFTDDSNAEYDYTRLVNRLYSNNKLAKELIPEQTFDTAKKIYSVDRIDTVDVFDDDEFPDVAQNIAGKFNGNTSYIVVNLSGVLDPNFTGGAPRGVGGTPAQFDLSELPGIGNEANETTFLSDRNSIGWYESMAEVSRAPGVTAADLKCMYPFSMFVDNDSSKFGVYTNAADYDLAKIRKLAEELEDVLRDDGRGYADTDFDSGSKFATVLNFIDYLDDDNIPGSGNPRLGVPPYATPCVEAFPMINEIYLSSSYNSQITGNQYKYKMNTKLNIELWYPFVSPKCADNYALEYTIRFGPTDLETVNGGVKALDLIPDEVTPAGADHTPGSRDWTEKITLVPANLDATSNSGLWNMGNRSFDLEPDNEWRYTDLTNITLNLPAGSMVISVDAKIVDKNDSSIIYDGFDWDVTSSDDDFMIQFVNFDETAIDGNRQRINEKFDMQVVDPRLNYKVVKDGATWWEDMSGRADPEDNLSSINQATQNYWSTNEYADSGWQMFIKGYEGNPNPVFLESIGEFGYIFTGRPWETVRLVDKNNGISRHLIYEYFSLEGNATNSGCANINTEFSEVLKAALKNMPLGPEAGAEVLIDESDDELSRLVDAIQDLTKDGGISPTNLLSRANQTKIFNAIWPTVAEEDLTEFQKEAFYISGYPALRSDQQLFAVFSMGHYYSSRQICMAIVWRDPVPDEDGRHPCFIRELIWLNGE